MLPATINIFEKAAKKAGKLLVRDFGEIENLQIQSKRIGDFVTSADLKVEKSLLETLKYYFPNANYLTEESGSIKGEGETIVIDPIDGTSNFIHGIPHVGIVIGKIINNDSGNSTVFNFDKTEFNLSNYATRSTIFPKIQENGKVKVGKLVFFTNKACHGFYENPTF